MEIDDDGPDEKTVKVNGRSSKVYRLKTEDRTDRTPPVAGVNTVKPSDCVWTGVGDGGKLTLQMCQNCKYLKKGLCFSFFARNAVVAWSAGGGGETFRKNKADEPQNMD